MNTKIVTSKIVLDILIAKGVEDVVICPGSRNAPLILGVGHRKEIRKHSIVDERSAGFFALGLSLKTKKPSLLISTSGTAVLNFAPAIAEAYYQKISLIVLTADRPDYLIDQADSQSLRQNGIFANYIQKSFTLSHRLHGQNDIAYAERMVNETWFLAEKGGPVHINLPFEEPLYDIVENTQKYRSIEVIPAQRTLSPTTIEYYKQVWTKASKKIIILGQSEYNSEWQEIFNEALDESCIIISETLSNIHPKNSISGIDKLLQKIIDKDKFLPEILITTGGAIVSKKIKQFLRDAPLFEHWHFQKETKFLDTYFHLTKIMNVELGYFIKEISLPPKVLSGFRGRWLKLKQKSEENHLRYLREAPWSDLKVYEILFSRIPKDSCLHLANSTPVRYAQLFEEARGFLSFSNRGTSGIDGSLSTAIGYATLSPVMNTIITGDLSFFYDSNALLNTLPNNLKIILINNHGGNIFRFIPGPQDSGLLEEFFEAKHNRSAKYMAKNFDIPYHIAVDENELKKTIEKLYQEKGGAILEVITDGELSAAVLKRYFSSL